MTTAGTLNVAYCGLYCGACGMFKKGSCKGCNLNEKAAWCKIRTCCIEHTYTSCADCTEFTDPMQCKKFNSVMSKIFAFIFKSDRAACIRQIKEKGLEGHAKIMLAKGLQSIRKK